jgi:hypothetical protein
VEEVSDMIMRRITTVALIPYVLWLIFSYRYHFIDGVNLLFHEAGHVIFAVFGQTMQFLGGTLGQLFFPAAFVVYFLMKGKKQDAVICGVWFGESLMYTAEYLADARVMVLPLVGGHIHDWNWLLARAGLLSQCEEIALTIHIVASIIVSVCVGLSIRWSFGPLMRQREASRAPGKRGRFSHRIR